MPRTTSRCATSPTPAIVPLTLDEERKRRAIFCYTSQIPPLENEHALTSGSGASAVAYVETQGPDGQTRWGVGRDTSILDASLHAVISAANRHRDAVQQAT